MEEKKNGKTPKVGPKPFLSVGPTLHYSHQNVQRCWLASVAVFCLVCLFWSKILTGKFFSFDPTTFTNIEHLRIGRFVTAPVSIFEYPWQILVLGLLIAVIAVVPTLVSQLMSFKHSVLFIAAIIFFANLPAFAAVVLISSLAAACRPLRFRSRFIAIALCIAPQMIYWGMFGSVHKAEPIRWGFSFAPWICAWLISLMIAGFVLGVGHFTRYRPGLVWSSSAALLITAVLLFGIKVDFDELDYQLYVANNNPKETVEFHDHSVKEVLDETINNKQLREYFSGFFLSADDSIALRVQLKNKIKTQLKEFGRWPSWLKITDDLNYQDKKDWLSEQYDIFIIRRPTSRRMPIALYYKAILNELSPDVRVYESKEVLHFYSDYPFESSRQLWFRLYSDFPQSPESIEARWRIAKHWAGAEMFELAGSTLDEAIEMATEKLRQFSQTESARDSILSIFEPPADSALTALDLEQLLSRLRRLRELISEQNLGKSNKFSEHLATFIMLNPHEPEYVEKLDTLLAVLSKKHPLYDNIMLAKTTVIPDEQLRAERFAQLHSKFSDTDGGTQALYDLALLQISLWRQQDDANTERKKELLVKARQTLGMFIEMYPNNLRTLMAKETLDKLPSAD